MKDWYLDTPTPNATSGYENDVLSEYAQNNFSDILLTDIADAVPLYDSSLTIQVQIRAIIQGNTHNSQLKASEGTMLTPIGTCNAGMYITYDNIFWLITSQPRNNKCYEKVVIEQCDWNLKWQNDSGDIIERWCITSRQSSVGIDENKVIALGSGELKILIPYDSETIKIRKGKRFYIDNNTESPIPYEVQLVNTTSFVKNGNGYLEIIVKEDITSLDKDRPDLMLCDYISPTIPPDPTPTTKPYIATISYTRPSVQSGLWSRFKAVFKDTSGNVVDTLTAKWTITSDFTDKLTVTEETNAIKIGVDDDKLIGKTFNLKLEATDDSAEPDEIAILITSAF